MPPSGKPIDDFPAFNSAFGGPCAFNVDLYNPDDANDYLDLIHNPDADPTAPKASGIGLFQPASSTPLPNNLSPTASDPDPDSSSESSRSPKAAAMDAADTMDLEGHWDDFIHFGNDQTNADTINPADIDRPMGNGAASCFPLTLFPDAERESPAFDSSSPSESNSSCSAVNDSDESLPIAMDVKHRMAPIQPQPPQSRNKRLSVCSSASSCLLCLC